MDGDGSAGRALERPRLDDEELGEAGRRRLLSRVPLGQLEVRRAVPLLGDRQLRVELREARLGGEVRNEKEESLVAPHLDERADEKEVEPLLRLAPAAARRAQGRDVGVRTAGVRLRAEAPRLLRRLAEVAQLLGGEGREPVDQSRIARVAADEGESEDGRLQLAGGVVGNELGQTRDGALGPGRGVSS